MTRKKTIAISLLAMLAVGCPLRQDAVVPLGDGGTKSGGAGAAGGTPSTGGTPGTPNTGGMSGTPGTGGLSIPGTGGAFRPETDGGTDVAPGAPQILLALGAACSARSECSSDNCVDGVCCDTACVGSCSQCNLKALEGKCSPVPLGTAASAPHAPCTKTPAATCGQNGLCDGKGACQLYASGELCGGGSCNPSTQQAVTGASCNGLGACVPASAIACTPFKCKADGSACAATCSSETDCQGQPCVSGSCGKVANGSRCTGAVQCTSGNCVDGYCCDLSCAGACQACDLPGSIGKCTVLAANQTPRNTRTGCVAGTCGSRCDGVAQTCTFAPSTTPCGTAQCANGMVTAAVACDGRGTCPVATVTSCGGFGCAGTACKASCTTDADCASGTPYCSGGNCQAKKPLGRVCSLGTECASGNCVNGVCCGSASCPACQACNLGTPGTCNTKAAGTADSACVSTDCNSGTCNGMGSCSKAGDGVMCGTNRFCRLGACGACTPNQSCQPNNSCKNGTTSCATGTMICSETTNKAANTPCGPPQSCANGVRISASVCSESGTCPVPVMTTCTYGCNSAGTDCNPPVLGGPCQQNSDCAPLGPSFYCLKTFDIFAIPSGLCTRPCDGRSLTDCSEMAGACVSETITDTRPSPTTACFPTCKADAPCRTGFRCNFVYRNNMLVEPSICVPE